MPLPDLSPEFQFITSRSSGAGGQHVNKTETKVTLLFNINSSAALTASQKEVLSFKLKHRINSDGNLLVSSQKFRSQYKNKKDCIKKLYALFEKALLPMRPRKKTFPSKKQHENRLNAKRLNAEKKNRRKNNFL